MKTLFGRFSYQGTVEENRISERVQPDSWDENVKRAQTAPESLSLAATRKDQESTLQGHYSEAELSEKQ